MFSALVQAGDDDIDPMAVVQVQQDIHTMHAQLDALRLLQAAARKHHDHACVRSLGLRSSAIILRAGPTAAAARPAFRYKIDPALISQSRDASAELMEEHATKLRRRTRNVRKKLAQVAVLEKKEAAE